MKFTKFNPEGKEVLTYGECLRPACEKIKTREDAAQYFKAYVAFIQKAIDKEGAAGKDKDAAAIAKSNLGYFAGYYDGETMERVNRLFDTAHPIFGRAFDVTPKQALEAGIKAGKAAAKKAAHQPPSRQYKGKKK